jgi:hypothetical protein
VQDLADYQRLQVTTVGDRLDLKFFEGTFPAPTTQPLMLPLLCKLFPKSIVKLLTDHLSGEVDPDQLILEPAEQKRRITVLEGQISELERREELVVQTILANGGSAHRRIDSSPLAVLQIAIEDDVPWTK